MFIVCNDVIETAKVILDNFCTGIDCEDTFIVIVINKIYKAWPHCHCSKQQELLWICFWFTWRITQCQRCILEWAYWIAERVQMKLLSVLIAFASISLWFLNNYHKLHVTGSMCLFSLSNHSSKEFWLSFHQLKLLLIQLVMSLLLDVCDTELP